MEILHLNTLGVISQPMTSSRPRRVWVTLFAEEQVARSVFSFAPWLDGMTPVLENDQMNL